MRTAREEALQVLAEVSRYCPEMRLGQLVANLAVAARGAVPEAIWDMEDEELLEAARRELDVLRARSEALAS